jgi:hypothetical protein
MQLTRESDVVGRERRLSDKATDLGGGDGPEFSSEPMPAAYGIYYSVGFGLLLLAALLAIFW